MSRHHSLWHALGCTIAIVVSTLLAGCGGEPEKPVVQESPVVVTETEQEVPVNEIGLPQTNATIGVTVRSAPDGIVATYNGERWIELVERDRPTVLYTFIAHPDRAPGATAASVEDFKNRISSYSNGEITGGGSMSTVLGQATWASGRYSEDGETLENIYVLAAHPSGSGSLILTSSCPQHVASVEERLRRIEELLEFVD